MGEASGRPTVPDTLCGGLLRGKVAMVTGAAAERGIGRAICALFAAHGARVALVDIDGRTAESAAAALGATHVGVACDIASEADCTAAALDVARRLGPIDVLVNNAGIGSRRAFLDITPEEFDRTMAVNARGTFLMTRAVLPAMLERRRGNLVFVSSTAEQRGGGVWGSSHYATSKAAMSGFARAIAREHAPSGIRANIIAPNLIKTDITVGMSDADRANVERGVPMQRSGTPMDVAGAALFLASDLSAYTTGATIDVNGGFHIR
jgi:NAD(P)-dependent dehydrogenase (short-subunit alcohol dehydrogenase family)